jgi:YD repeat-containing protein
VYAAALDGLRLTFQVFGVWRKNMVIRDRQTGTIWQQATGEAIDGPLKGRRLEVLPAWETTWGALLSAVPQACYTVAPRKFTGLMPMPILQRMLGLTHWANLNGLSARDTRLEPHQIVIGLVINGAAKAYPLALLRAQPVHTDQVGGETIRLEYHAAGDQVAIYDAQGNRKLAQRLWWSAWSEFHPRSELYGAPVRDSIER